MTAKPGTWAHHLLGAPGLPMIDEPEECPEKRWAEVGAVLLRLAPALFETLLQAWEISTHRLLIDKTHQDS